jgi:hypothetical protein
MHGNKKLCWVFLGKCIGAPYEILTTKKPPNLLMRGLFIWLIIRLRVQPLVLELELAVLQFVIGPGL